MARGRSNNRRARGSPKIFGQKRKRDSEGDKSPEVIASPSREAQATESSSGSVYVAPSNEAPLDMAWGTGTSAWEILAMDKPRPEVVGQEMTIYYIKERGRRTDNNMDTGNEGDDEEEDALPVAATNKWNVSKIEKKASDTSFILIEDDEDDKKNNSGDTKDTPHKALPQPHPLPTLRPNNNNFRDEVPGTSQNLRQEMSAVAAASAAAANNNGANNRVLGKPPLPPKSVQWLQQERAAIENRKRVTFREEEQVFWQPRIPSRHEPRDYLQTFADRRQMGDHPRPLPLILSQGNPFATIRIQRPHRRNFSPPRHNFSPPRRHLSPPNPAIPDNVPRKPSVFQRVKNLFQSKKEASEVERIERERYQRELRERREAEIERRRVSFRMYTRRTYRGQPFMSARVEKLLEKLQESDRNNPKK